MKHTPGPWKAKNVRGHENDLVYCAIESKHRPIAFAGVYKEKYNIDGVEAQWNAQLIAAAPELLEALELVLNHCNKISAAHGQDIYNKMMTHKCIEMAEEAIKKATS